MTSTQKPHITDFKGVVSISCQLLPAPTVSAINPDYKVEIETIKDNLNVIEANSIEIKPFDGLGQLSGIFADLITTSEPYKIQQQ
jgi:CRISPR-associated protein Cst2